MSFFDSRWVRRPDGVTETTGLPAGFRAGATAAGIKPSGDPDLAVLVCDAPEATSAARFTRSSVLAAPVQLCLTRCDLGALRAVVANAGNANAATGRRGLEDAAKVQGAGALALAVDERALAVASTGVIGVPLPVDNCVKGLVRARETLRADGDDDFAQAIRTTDAFAKRASLELELPDGKVRLAAQAKGAGMIAPGFATLLCFIETDAALSREQAGALLGAALPRSFERISVDGQLSTNDTVLLLASGASGVAIAPGTGSEQRFGAALDALLLQLALLVVRDGEGAKRVARVSVRGGGAAEAERAARAVADSPLVKAALYGGDPNWGRIAAAVGMALPRDGAGDLLGPDIRIEGVQVCRAGAAAEFDAATVARAVERDEVEYEVALDGDDGGAEAVVYFSDLSHDYVTLNAEYTT